ncbi:MAG TPA: DUF72 domain-containing protein [Puia sp.]|nr:DUF72 domain-containing protein [Puia sp.]
MPSNFYCGTSGLVLPVPNKQAFPEAYRAGSRLTYYASLFNSLEVNSCFYKIPKPATFARWTQETPPGFRFTIKLWKGITHVPSLDFSAADLDRFMQTAAAIGPKKGCLLIQLPPGAKADTSPQLQRLLEKINQTLNPPLDHPAISGRSPRAEQPSISTGRSPRADHAAVAGQLPRAEHPPIPSDHPWRLAVEFRDRSWYTDSTDNLLKRFNATRVLQDIPRSFNWQPMPETATIYLRYHGPAGDYKGTYSEERLIHDADQIKEWLSHGKEVYVYFNNTIGDALPNARFLIDHVQPRYECQPPTN